MRLLFQPEAEEADLAKVFRSRGFGAELAESVAYFIGHVVGSVQTDVVVTRGRGRV